GRGDKCLESPEHRRQNGARQLSASQGPDGHTEGLDEHARRTYAVGSSCEDDTPALRAASTRSGVIGTSRRQIPAASKTALAMAAGTGTMEGSPPPLGGISGRLISTTSISGMSGKWRIG